MAAVIETSGLTKIYSLDFLDVDETAILTDKQIARLAGLAAMGVDLGLCTAARPHPGLARERLG